MLSNRQQRRLAIVLAALITILLFSAVHSVKHTAGPAQTQTEYKDAKHSQNSEPSESTWHWLTKDAASFFTFILAALTSVLAVVSIIQIVYLRRSDQTSRIAADSARKAANSALKQVRIAERTLIANERAWLSAEVHSWSDLGFYRTGNADMFVTFLIKNFGKTPAINVHTSITMIENQFDAPALGKEFAESVRKINTTYSRVLMPEQSYERKYGVGIDNFRTKPGDSFLPAIIACVTYQVLPDLSLHQTLTCYHVSEADIEGRSGGLLTVGRFVSKDGLQMEVTSGGWAD